MALASEMMQVPKSVSECASHKQTEREACIFCDRVKDRIGYKLTISQCLAN